MINVFFNGRLGADAEAKTSQSGNQFLTMNVAVDNYHKGERSTIWVRVAVVGDRYLKMKEYYTKGKPISVNGVLQVSTYVNKNGETVIAYDVNADRIEFINSSSGNTQSTEASVSTGTLQPKTAVKEEAEVAVVTAADTKEVDELPF